MRAEARRPQALRAEALRVLAAAPDSSARPVWAARVRSLREQWGGLPAAARRVIVSELFERVVVHADKSVEVVPRYGTERAKGRASRPARHSANRFASCPIAGAWTRPTEC